MSSFAYVSLCPAICLCISLRCYVFLCPSHFWPRAVPFVRPRIRLYVYMVILLCPPLHTTRIFGVHLPLVYVMLPRSSFLLSCRFVHLIHFAVFIVSIIYYFPNYIHLAGWCRLSISLGSIIQVHPPLKASFGWRERISHLLFRRVPVAFGSCS